MHTMDSFEFEYGRVLENVDVQYFTLGTPKYDDDGFITNAILYFPTFSGTFSFLRESYEYIRDNSNLLEECFIIHILSLGTPNSCSPSSTGLNYNFPKYTCVDEVNFKRQFLAEKFKIKKILGLIGEGIGGYQVLTWACDYPDEMEFIFVANTAAKLSGYRYVISKVLDNIIDATEDYYSDGYSVSKTKTVLTINSLLFAHSASKKVFNNLSNEEITAIFDDFNEEGFFIDIYDFKYRNDCDMDFDVVDKLSNITAKSFFVGTNNNYFHSELDLLPLKESIKDSILIIYDANKKEYYFDQEDYIPVGNHVIEFIGQFLKKD